MVCEKLGNIGEAVPPLSLPAIVPSACLHTCKPAEEGCLSLKKKKFKTPKHCLYALSCIGQRGHVLWSNPPPITSGIQIVNLCYLIPSSKCILAVTVLHPCANCMSCRNWWSSAGMHYGIHVELRVEWGYTDIKLALALYLSSYCIVTVLRGKKCLGEAYQSHYSIDVLYSS